MLRILAEQPDQDTNRQDSGNAHRKNHPSTIILDQYTRTSGGKWAKQINHHKIEAISKASILQATVTSYHAVQ